MHDFLEILKERPMLFDGAIGTELYRRGVFLSSNFEELNLTRPQLVLGVHREYLTAGAEILTTNSYGANRFRLDRFGLAGKVRKINRRAGELAREAAGRTAWVAGSVGPSGLEPAEFLGPGAQKLREALNEQILSLVEGGVDLILLETFSQLAEIQVAMEVAQSAAPHLPLLATMRFEPSEKLMDGSDPESVAVALKQWGADVVGPNCGKGPELIFRVAQRMLGAGVPVMAQPNAGTPEMLEGRTIYAGNPEYFGVFGRRMLKAGVRIVGGCCGTTPSHVHRMRGAVRMMGGALKIEREDSVVFTTDEVEMPAPVERKPRLPLADRSPLARKLAAGKFVVSVEVNPPLGLDTTKVVEAARMLQEAGVDIINTADGPRASVRMSNQAMAVHLQQEAGIEVLLHLCCRDRNLLGLQSDVLGAHALGIRDLLVITGDPPKLGDYPDATAVYDLDSIGLLQVIDGFNHGIDPVGNAIAQQTNFVLGTGVEPEAMDYDREIRRLEMKVAAGADFVMTQPVYDLVVFERFLDDIAHLQIPVLMGVLPLASSRNAEFLHENVPGVNIPAEIRRRMKEAGGGEKAHAMGVKIAQEAVKEARSRIQGLYIMPPLGRYEMALEILAVLGEDGKNGPQEK